MSLESTYIVRHGEYPGDIHLDWLRRTLGIHVPVTDPARALPTREEIIAFMARNLCFMLFRKEPTEEIILGLAYVTEVPEDTVPQRITFHIGMISIDDTNKEKQFTMTIMICNEVITHLSREYEHSDDRVVLRLNVTRQWARKLAGRCGFRRTLCAMFQEYLIPTLYQEPATQPRAT